MSQKINPVGLKGQEITERMKQLMGIKPINENKKTSVVELTKKGPDGNVYGIVRENHEYYIKVTKKQTNIVTEDFQYIGGLQNKKQEAYPSYAKAIKHLNLKFHSLNEALGKQGNFNVFQDDKLLKEDFAAFSEMSGPMFKNEGNLEGHMKSECCGGQVMEGMCLECGGPAYGMMDEMQGMEEYDEPAMASFQKQYGDEKGKQVYYATANKQDRDPETFEKNEGMDMMAQGEKKWETLRIKITDVKKGDFIVVMGNSYYVTGMPYYKNGVYYVPTEYGTFESEKNKVEVNRMKDYERLSPEMEAVQGMMEKEMTDKEKKFAKLAPPYDTITYADKIAGATKGKNEGKLSIERAMSMMDEMIDELHESKSKKKL